MAGTPLVSSGVFEFVFGALETQREAVLRFWSVLGFETVSEGAFSAAEAEKFYGHASPLTSIRLKHKGCDTYGTGFVRLQLWSELRNEGLGSVSPIVTGSRWMGMYTHDVLQVRDSFTATASQEKWKPWISPLVHAPLANPPPPVDFYQPFVGLREQLVFCPEFRLAFIQRAGFDRPGFGTFDDSLAFKNTEGSHANVVQAGKQFSTDFYKSVFGYETAPFGEPHDSGDEEPTIAALNLQPGELFRIERTRAPDCPSGILQVYSSYQVSEDLRDQSRAGSGGLCLYTVKAQDMEELSSRVSSNGGRLRSSAGKDEFGTPAVYFDSADGYSWLSVANVE